MSSGSWQRARVLERRPSSGTRGCFVRRLVAMTAGDHRAAGRLLLATTALTSAFRSGCYR